MIGTTIQGLLVLNYPDYVWHQYHGTLLAIAVVVFAVIFNTFFAARLPMLEGIVLVLHFVGFFVIMIPLWVMAPRSSPHVLIEFSNNGGWSSVGLSAMIGAIIPVNVITGFDCVVHMCKATTAPHVYA